MEADELKRNWRVALQRIAEGSECECECDDAECCEEVDQFCTGCIARRALALENPEQ